MNTAQNQLPHYLKKLTSARRYSWSLTCCSVRRCCSLALKPSIALSDVNAANAPVRTIRPTALRERPDSRAILLTDCPRGEEIGYPCDDQGKHGAFGERPLEVSPTRVNLTEPNK